MPSEMTEHDATEMWKSKWRGSQEMIKDLREQNEALEIELHRVRKINDELRGERNEARRLIPQRALARPKTHITIEPGENEKTRIVTIYSDDQRSKVEWTVAAEAVKSTRG